MEVCITYLNQISRWNQYSNRKTSDRLAAPLSPFMCFAAFLCLQSKNIHKKQRERLPNNPL